jgi:hypothetical protein
MLLPSFCYLRALDLAASKGLRSVAFPCLSTGIFAFDKAAAADIALGAVSSWLSHRGSTSSIVSIVFAINQDDDEQLYVARWPKFFPAPESAASLPEAAVPSRKRAVNGVAILESRGGQSTKTRRGLAAAGEQPTIATTGRMLLVEDTEEGTSPLQRIWAMMEQSIGPAGLARQTDSSRMGSEVAVTTQRVCKYKQCGQRFMGNKRAVCPHCGWKAH